MRGTSGRLGRSTKTGANRRCGSPRWVSRRKGRQSCSEARQADKPKETEIRRLIINMERWRWMPEDLGPLHVWLNTPEFMLYVMKDGEKIYQDKTLVARLSTPRPSSPRTWTRSSLIRTGSRRLRFCGTSCGPR